MYFKNYSNKGLIVSVQYNVTDFHELLKSLVIYWILSIDGINETKLTINKSFIWRTIKIKYY